MDIIALITIIIVTLGLLFYTHNDSKDKKRYLIITSIILIFISGLRNVYWGSPDNYGYFQYYSQVCRMSYSDIIPAFPKDPGYHMFAKTLSLIIGDHYQIYLLIISSIFIGSIARLIYVYSQDKLLSIILFLSLGIFQFSMMGIRQSLAMAMIVLSFEWLLKHNFKIFIVWIVFATLFHQTSIVFLFAYPLTSLKINKYTIFLYIGILAVVMILGRITLDYLNPIFAMDERFEGYMDRDVVLTYSGLIQLCLFLGLSLLFYKKAISKNRNNQIMMHLLLIAIIFQSMSSLIAEFFRVALYFKLFLIIMIPNILVYSKKRKGISFVLMLLLLYYFMVMNSDIHDYAFYWERYIPKY